MATTVLKAPEQILEEQGTAQSLAARANRAGIQAAAVNHAQHGWIVKVAGSAGQRSIIIRDGEDLRWLMHDRGMVEAIAA